MLALRQLDFASAQRYFIAARELPGFYGQEAVDAGYVQLAALGALSTNASTAIGVTFVNAGLPLFARAPLERAVAEDPEDAAAHAYLAWVNVLSGQQDAAGAQVSLALTFTPADPFARFVAASQEATRGEWAAAAADCTVGLQHDDRNPALWLLLARSQEGQRAYLDAELSYENAADLAAEPEYTQHLLEFYIGHRLGLTDGRAYSAAVRAEMRWPGNAALRKLEGQIDDLIGQPAKAYASWTAARDLAPGDPEPWFMLGHYAYVGGDLTAAVVFLRTAVALQPGSDWAAQARNLLAPLPNAAL
jgi:predicted Zn-dependent protease